MSYQFKWGHPLVKLSKVGLALQVKNSFVLSMVENSFVLLMWVPGAFLVNVQKVYCRTKQLVQWPNLMLKGVAR